MHSVQANSSKLAADVSFELNNHLTLRETFHTASEQLTRTDQ
jgi:hypothetical protein